MGFFFNCTSAFVNALNEYTHLIRSHSIFWVLRTTLMFLPTPTPPLPRLSVFQSSSSISLTSSLSYLASHSLWELQVPFRSLPSSHLSFHFKSFHRDTANSTPCSQAPFVHIAPVPLFHSSCHYRMSMEMTKPTESLPHNTFPAVHWQWRSSPQPCGRTSSTTSCSVVLTGMPKQQGEHSMSCTARFAGDSYTLLLRLTPNTNVDCTRYLLSNPKHRITPTQHHVYGKVYLV